MSDRVATRAPVRSQESSVSIKHWINGRQVDSKDRFVTYNPATGEAIAEVAGARSRSKAPPRPGPTRPPRAPDAPLGELIDQNVPMLAELACRSRRRASS